MLFAHASQIQSSENIFALSISFTTLEFLYFLFPPPPQKKKRKYPICQKYATMIREIVEIISLSKRVF